MELIVDNSLKRAYALYYEKTRAEVVLEIINNMFAYYDPEVVIDTINVIKTCMVLGYTYTRCYDEVKNKIKNKFPIEDDMDKFILSMVLKMMIATGSQDIEELMKSPRNIEREVAAKYFRVMPRKVTEEMIKDVSNLSVDSSDAYSYDDTHVEGWDEYFYNICRQTARNSKCLSRRIGTVLVKDKSIISTGYNGPPRGIPRCDLRWQLDDEFSKKYGDSNRVGQSEGVCPRRYIGYKSGEGLDICLATHAEVNAITNAARHGIATKGTTMYMTCGIPCHNCLQVIINAGVKEIVVTSLKVYDESSMYLLKQSDLNVRLFNFSN